MLRIQREVVISLSILRAFIATRLQVLGMNKTQLAAAIGWPKSKLPILLKQSMAYWPTWEALCGGLLVDPVKTLNQIEQETIESERQREEAERRAWEAAKNAAANWVSKNGVTRTEMMAPLYALEREKKQSHAHKFPSQPPAPSSPDNTLPRPGHISMAQAYWANGRAANRENAALIRDERQRWARERFNETG